MNDTVKINIAKVLEQAMISLREEGQPSLERLYSLWEEHLGYAAETVAAGVNLHLDHIADVTPELVMNLMFHGSLERGLGRVALRGALYCRPATARDWLP